MKLPRSTSVADRFARWCGDHEAWDPDVDDELDDDPDDDVAEGVAVDDCDLPK